VLNGLSAVFIPAEARVVAAKAPAECVNVVVSRNVGAPDRAALDNVSAGRMLHRT
jgi:hypothetical protein